MVMRAFSAAKLENLATMVNKGNGDESIQCKVLELFSENPRLSLISGIGLN
jgi:hypothetical protein